VNNLILPPFCCAIGQPIFLWTLLNASVVLYYYGLWLESDLSAKPPLFFESIMEKTVEAKDTSLGQKILEKAKQRFGEGDTNVKALGEELEKIKK
jgi:hypothetical protein